MDHRQTATDLGVKSTYGLFIDGEWCAAADRTIESVDPTTGDVLATLADATVHRHRRRV